VRSLHNALKSLGLNSKISNEVSSITDATHLVLPGVGGFSASMEKINDLLPLDVIRLQISKGKPFLGICVGMQVLCAIGYEHGETLGLNYFEGNIVRFPESTLPVPHVGWNNVAYKPQSALFQKMVANPDFYFVHSFFLDMPTDRPEVAAFTDYILSFPSAIEKDNIFGVQFHPEKSQKNGKILLRNFAGIT
jgi:glutamine amidotransferase